MYCTDVPNLFVVETVDDEKLAAALEAAWSKRDPSLERLRIMVQVNTSGEEAKSGCSPTEAAALVSYVLTHCPHLHFIGLMTIGIYDYDISRGPNPDFVVSGIEFITFVMYWLLSCVKCK